MNKVWKSWEKKPTERGAHTTLTAGVYEEGDRRRDCGLSAANYIHPPAPLPCHELLRLHALHTAPGFRSPTHMLSLTLPDYAAATNQYSQALGMETPLELLLSVRSFAGIVCAHGSHITGLNSGVRTLAHSFLHCLYIVATPIQDLQWDWEN